VNEFFDVFKEPDGAEWFVVTTIVRDPQYLNGPWVTSSNFKKETDTSKWSPRPARRANHGPAEAGPLLKNDRSAAFATSFVTSRRYVPSGHLSVRVPEQHSTRRHAIVIDDSFIRRGAAANGERLESDLIDGASLTEIRQQRLTMDLGVLQQLCDRPAVVDDR
jgi:hypothetical protein